MHAELYEINFEIYAKDAHREEVMTVFRQEKLEKDLHQNVRLLLQLKATRGREHPER